MIYIKEYLRFLLAILLLVIISGCSMMPHYKSMDDYGSRHANTDVAYSIDPIVAFEGIDCLAIMPLDISLSALEPMEFVSFEKPSNQTSDYGHISNDDIYPFKLDANDKREMLRKMLFAYIAPHDIRDVELAEVDKWIQPEQKPDYTFLSKKLDCHWFLEGEVTKFSVNYFGVYSNIVVAADLKIVNGKTNKEVWHGRHEARSDDGSVPLTPIDLAVGAFRAATNINPEQLERTVADLARRVTRTMPLDEDNSFLFAARRKQLLQVVASSLNLRDGPGQDYTVNRILKNKEHVTLLQNSKNEPWLLVQTIDGQTGYVSSQYLN